MFSSKRPLLLSRRFAPLFAVQFLIAFNGNFAKTAMLFLVAFSLPAAGEGVEVEPSLFSALAAGVFVAPFLMFSAMAGKLADGRDKARLIRSLKLYETVVMAIAATALLAGSVFAMLAALFLIGCQSAFLGPIKYAIIPQHVASDEVLSATGLVEAGTFVAILLGQIFGGIAPASAVAISLVAISLVGLVASFAIPAAPPLGEPAAERRAMVPFAQTWRIVASAKTNRRLWHAILAISWFWAIGALATSQLVVMVEAELFASPAVATAFLAIFSVGISAGSLIASKLLDAEISGRLAPPAAVGMSLGLFLLLAGTAIAGPQAGTRGIVDFLFSPTGVLAFVGLSLMAVCGGVFVVPLYAILQTAGAPDTRSRDIAANNILNAVAMVGAAGTAAALTSLKVKVSEIFLLLAVANLIVAGTAFAMRSRAGAQSPV
ncbi:MFS transporter [Porphyrobacter sp. YT40]|uniref:MFS transporter n=1 Tax=Porphyrobacter sp. YT40 TaxID=2547601 RepID=UPI001141AE6C|nr:MFS transporter [Porphyrobacter sp. YT40]QDH35115.1 MFS transporter [Porphyrobacter sp. YT40]